jgi:hypothetical protein
LSYTQAAEKARQARSKRKGTRIQKGGVLRAGDWRKIQQQKEEDTLTIAERAEANTISKAKREREKVQKQQEREARKAIILQKRREREAKKASKL